MRIRSRTTTTPQSSAVVAPAPVAAKEVAPRGRSGRPTLYTEPLDRFFTVRFSEEQSEHVRRWCTSAKCSPSTLVREVGLARAGATHLGLGLANIRGTVERQKSKSTAELCFPVKCTVLQEAAIAGHCSRFSIKPATFLRHATLAFIGHAVVDERAAELGRVSQAIG